jgi:xylulose-5-phosphate/fructose-6-phosphate phosphoketolase
MEDKRLAARAWTRDYGEDAPEIREWAWPAKTSAASS